MRRSSLGLLALGLLPACALITAGDLDARLDLDGDGVPRPTDCDDDDAATTQYTFYGDGDGDGYGGPTTVLACSPPDGFVTNADDCNDADPTVVGLTWYADVDLDTFGDPATALAQCDGPNGYVLDGTDCDDSRADVHPGARDYCDDGADNDCDGTLDNLQWFVDADDDDFGAADDPIVACDPPDGYAVEGTDCDDADPDVHPYATEVCDEGGPDGAGVDEDCNGLVNDADPGVTGRTYWYVDEDGDGYGGGSPVAACTQVSGRITDGSDCDDADAGVNPAADEVWYDGVDQDCDGNDTDQDVDGYPSADDCDDTDPFVNPAALEACGDDVDNDCDGVSAGQCRLTGDLTGDDAGAVLYGSIEDGAAGSVMAGVGDIDGDGYDDVVVGAPGAQDDAGVFYFARGPVDAMVDLEADAERFEGCASYYTTTRVPSAGADLDGDGRLEWLLASPGDNEVFLLGDAGGALCDVTTGVTGERALGLAAAGDATGDGAADLLVGDASTNDYAGRAYLVPGPVTGEAAVVDAAALTIEPSVSDELGALGYLGFALIDLSGDGVDEVIVSQYGETGAGAVFVLDGAQSGSVSVDTADGVIWGAGPYDSVSSEKRTGGGQPAGDTDGDGRLDLLIGDITWPDNNHRKGAIFAFTTPFTGAVTVDDADGNILGDGDQFAYTSAVAGDVDGDGRDDALVQWFGGELLFLGPIAGSRGVSDAVASIDEERNGVAAGDVNADGFDDILVGDVSDSTYGSAAGAALLYYGGTE